MKAIKFLIGLMAVLLLASCQQKPKLSEAEITQIAKEAYIYGYPMVKNYRAMYAQSIDISSPEYKKPFNELSIGTAVYVPGDKTMVMPNVDLASASVWFDLRREPYVITVPAVEDHRYFSVQFVDAMTYNFDYLSTRTGENKGGQYLIAGPNWKGEKPVGIDRVIQAETDLVYAAIRVQIHHAEDPASVQKIQEQFMIQPLSHFTNTPAPAEAVPLSFPAYQDDKAKGPEFFEYVNFMMNFVPALPEEGEMLKRFASLGIEAGKPFKPDTLSDMEKKAIAAGMEAGQAELDAMQKDNIVRNAELYGTRAGMKNNYLYRAYGAMVNLHGPSAEEIMEVGYSRDPEMKPLSGANDYVIKLNKDQLPPAGFWSLTMYDLPGKNLVANAINRFEISSEMLAKLKSDLDGNFTIYIQQNAPAEDQVANWLPAPAGEFTMQLRLYMPKPEAANATAWKEPVIMKVRSGEPVVPPADQAVPGAQPGQPAPAGAPAVPVAPGAQPAPVPGAALQPEQAVPVAPAAPAAVPAAQPAPAAPAASGAVPAPAAPVAPAVPAVQPAKTQ